MIPEFFFYLFINACKFKIDRRNDERHSEQSRRFWAHTLVSHLAPVTRPLGGALARVVLPALLCGGNNLAEGLPPRRSGGAQGRTPAFFLATHPIDAANAEDRCTPGRAHGPLGVVVCALPGATVGHFNGLNRHNVVGLLLGARRGGAHAPEASADAWGDKRVYR